MFLGFNSDTVCSCFCLPSSCSLNSKIGEISFKFTFLLLFFFQVGSTKGHRLALTVLSTWSAVTSAFHASFVTLHAWVWTETKSSNSSNFISPFFTPLLTFFWWNLADHIHFTATYFLISLSSSTLATTVGCDPPRLIFEVIFPVLAIPSVLLCSTA